ncbi:MAG: ABC transporter permease subunit, partial [Thermoplasmata archaeon]|nr:ABC transporter permease subunit [Thermoplasmata archaeon]
HPFGILNGIGIDVMVGLVQATPIDLLLVGGTILCAVAIGVLLGSYGGYSRGLGDWLVTTTSDIVVGVPPFFFVLVLFLGIQPFVPADWALASFGLLFAAVLWPYYARPVRARAKLVSQAPYVEAARAAGAGDRQLLVRHVIPNSFYPVLAQVPVDVYNIFFVLTVFQFLGCFGGGAKGFFLTLTPLPGPSFPEWGYLLALGACYGWSILPGLNHWWMYTFPALTILLFGIAVTLTCDGIERLIRPFRAGV